MFALEIGDRLKIAKSKTLCLNCLKSNHTTNHCTSSTCCIAGPKKVSCYNSTTVDLNKCLSKFWEIEEFPSKVNLTLTSSFIVKISFKDDNFQLGDTFT